MRVRDAFMATLTQIREGTYRARMGLPDHYAVPEAESLSEAASKVYGAAPDELAGVAESVDAPLDTRLAAGTLLGLLGDPRIRPLDPHLVDIDGGAVSIGTPVEAVDAIFERYRHRAVQRAWIEKECPRHTVELPPYRIGRYLVTHAEFAGFLDATGFEEVPTSWAFARFAPALSNHPVHSVSHEAAEAYASWLSRETGRRFRLPTEAEWEYAAAGPEGWSFPCGDSLDGAGNTLETGLLMTTPVGCFPRGASCFGALDMAGNAEERTAEFYKPYPDGRPVEDHLGHEGTYRVCRGGAFTRFEDLSRCQRRHGTVGNPLYPESFRLLEEIQR